MKPRRIVVIGSDWPENEQWCPHWVSLKIGLKRLGIPFLFLSCRPLLNVDAVVSFEPDLVLYGLMDMVKNPQWRREIRERLPNAVIVLWYGDYRNDIMAQPDADCSEMDAMFVSNDAQEERYKRKWKMKEVHYLPLGCEPTKKPIYSAKFSFPFLFIGGQIKDGLFHERASFIETLRIKYGLIVVNSYEPEIRSRIYRAMPKLYGSSRTVVDVSHFTNVLRYTSIRYWEIPAYFGFALTKRFPGCEEMYPASMRVYFDTIEELVEKRNYYLLHETERKSMIEKAHERSYDHVYDKRLTTMFSLL